MSKYELALKQLICFDDIMQRTQTNFDEYVVECGKIGYEQSLEDIGSYIGHFGLLAMPSLHISNLVFVSNVLIFKVKREYDKMPKVKMELISKYNSMSNLADTLIVSVISKTNSFVDQIEIPLECYLWDVKEQMWRLNSSCTLVQADSKECYEYFKELSKKIFGYIRIFVDY